MRFGERMGFEPAKVIQYSTMDQDLRMDIYNWLDSYFEANWEFHDALEFCPEAGYSAAKKIWVYIARNDSAEFTENYTDFNSFLKSYILENEPYKVFELIEFLMSLPEVSINAVFLNHTLERNSSAFRYEPTLKEFVAITDETELISLKESQQLGNKYSSASRHIEKATQLLSKQPDPDLANAVKEAISAVEAAAKIASGEKKATLDSAIKELSAKDELHPALKDAWLKMYGYTSDAGGIRHASISPNDALDFATAKYMVVTCSAFVNLLCTLPPKIQSK